MSPTPAQVIAAQTAELRKQAAVYIGWSREGIPAGKTFAQYAKEQEEYDNA